MCGIAGYHGLQADHALLERMNDCQQHRGPDGEGIVTAARAAWPTGGCRSSTSRTASSRWTPPTGATRSPTTARSTTTSTCARSSWRSAAASRTDSDTEVVLQAFARGARDAFDRFNGMFGLAIWDREEQAADPGPRPLRHQAALRRRVAGAGRTSGEVCSSPARSSRSWPAACYDEAASTSASVYRYLRFRVHEDGTETFFDGIERLAPGRDARRPTRTASSGACFTRLKEELLELAHEQRPYDDAAAAEYKRAARRVGRGCGCSRRCRWAPACPAASTPRHRGHHRPAAQRGRRRRPEARRRTPEHLLGGVPRLDQRRGALRRRRRSTSARARRGRTRSSRPDGLWPTSSTSSAPRRSRSSPPARTRSTG